MGLINIFPEFDESDTTRIQPATIDMKIKEVEYTGAIFGGLERGTGNLTLQARCISSVNLTEFVDVWGGRVPGYWFFYLWVEDRSSLHRLGGYIANQSRVYTIGGTHQIELGNFGHNDIHLQEGEGVAQFYISVKPFADECAHLYQADDNVRTPTPELGEQVRSLDMGMEVVMGDQLKYLHDQGYFTVTPKLVDSGANILVHAGKTVYRMRTIEGGIDFSKRKEYTQDELFEPIDISNGYTIQPYEHIVVETRESFKLSPHIGIRFWDNVLDSKELKSYEHLRTDMPKSLSFISLTDSWIDPGYAGIFARQPKWLDGRTIYPGDVTGFGQVYFFPKGVERPYGSADLGSQYQGTKNTAFS